MLQVFQPMLMQYFSYEELKDIKKQVIAQHCSPQRCDSAAEVLKGLSLWSQAEELHKAFKYSDHEKTDDGESDAVLLTPWVELRGGVCASQILSSHDLRLTLIQSVCVCDRACYFSSRAGTRSVVHSRVGVALRGAAGAVPLPGA